MFSIFTADFAIKRDFTGEAFSGEFSDGSDIDPTGNKTFRCSSFFSAMSLVFPSFNYEKNFYTIKKTKLLLLFKFLIKKIWPLLKFWKNFSNN